MFRLSLVLLSLLVACGDNSRSDLGVAQELSDSTSAVADSFPVTGDMVQFRILSRFSADMQEIFRSQVIGSSSTWVPSLCFESRTIWLKLLSTDLASLGSGLGDSYVDQFGPQHLELSWNSGTNEWRFTSSPFWGEVVELTF
jgi:hypothetical protein